MIMYPAAILATLVAVLAAAPRRARARRAGYASS